jgi:hypothetical protein
MPVYEYEEYIKFLNQYYDEQNKKLQAHNTTPSAPNKGNTNKFGTLN